MADEGDGRARVVFNGKVGSRYRGVGTVVLSPDGRRVAYGAEAEDGKWRMVADGAERGPFEQVGIPAFSADGAHLVFSAKVGANWHLFVDDVRSPGTPARFVGYELSRDGSRVAFLEQEEGSEERRLVVADRTLTQRTMVEPRAAVILVTPDRTLLATVSEQDSGQRVVTVPFDRPEALSRGREYRVVSAFDVAYPSSALAYLAEGARGMVVVLDDKEVPAPPGRFMTYPVPRPDGRGCAAFVMEHGAVSLREFFVEGGVKEGTYDEAESLVWAPRGGGRAYAARRGERWFVVANGKEGPAFDRVVSPMFSPDGTRLVYRARDQGVRFVVVADAKGKVIRKHPAYEQVYPVQFTADGKSVAYGVKDGRRFVWQVEPL
jgi:hypothetical protein